MDPRELLALENDSQETKPPSQPYVAMFVPPIQSGAQGPHSLYHPHPIREKSDSSELPRVSQPPLWLHEGVCLRTMTQNSELFRGFSCGNCGNTQGRPVTTVAIHPPVSAPALALLASHRSVWAFFFFLSVLLFVSLLVF